MIISLELSSRVRRDVATHSGRSAARNSTGKPPKVRCAASDWRLSSCTTCTESTSTCRSWTSPARWRTSSGRQGAALRDVRGRRYDPPSPRHPADYGNSGRILAVVPPTGAGNPAALRGARDWLRTVQPAGKSVSHRHHGCRTSFADKDIRTTIPHEQPTTPWSTWSTAGATGREHRRSWYPTDST